MDARHLLHQLSTDPRLAEAFFSDREAWLVQLPEEDRDPLRRLDREGLAYLADGMLEEPPVAPEHGDRTPAWLQLVIVAWSCVVFVAFWLIFGGPR